MNQFDQFTSAMSEARQTLRAADAIADRLAQLREIDQTISTPKS